MLISVAFNLNVPNLVGPVSITSSSILAWHPRSAGTRMRTYVYSILDILCSCLEAKIINLSREFVQKRSHTALPDMELTGRGGLY